MSIRPVRLFTILSFLTALLALHLATVSVASAADYSHARVVRLSLVQGEVKVSRTGGSGDALSQNLAWEQAMVNLPIREGFVLATGQGRTEVEFESGAAAYLAENSVLQFTELALADGARITRLALTQGTATFYANLAREDSFIVKTPTLEVALVKKARVRVDTYDDGVSVSALHGEAEVTASAGTQHIRKGQLVSLRADNPNSFSIGRISKEDDWDHWVADRVETVQTATAAANTFSSPYYQAGVADLYSYGTFISYGGYNNCWRPRGVGFAWTPFSSGRWSFYPGFGWTWVSAEPWGWLPYHFGGWVYSPVYGWLWVPGQTHLWHTGFRPATAVFVQVNNRVGWLPMHPQDRRGERPGNMQYGVLTDAGAGSAVGAAVVHVPVTREEKIQVLRDAPRGLEGSAFRSATPPTHVSRRLDSNEDRGNVNRNDGERAKSGIVYDPQNRTYVNSNNGSNNGANNGAQANSNGAAAGTGNSKGEERGNSNFNSNVQGVAPVQGVTPVGGATGNEAPVKENAPRGEAGSQMRGNRGIVRQNDGRSDGNDGENAGTGRPISRVAPVHPDAMPVAPPSAPQSSVEPSRPARVDSPQAPQAPPINRPRVIGHDDVNSNGNGNDNFNRSRGRMPAPVAPPETMRSMPPPPRANFPPPSAPPRSMPAPSMPPPRVEPMHPPSPSVSPAPRLSPPPSAPRQQQGQQSGHQQQQQ